MSQKFNVGDRVIAKSDSIVKFHRIPKNATGTVKQVYDTPSAHLAKVEFPGFHPFWMRMCDLTKEAAE